MVLSEVKENGVYHVKMLRARGELHRHLEDMGFLPGEPISVVSHFSGNVIVNVKGSRVALSDEMAKDILV